ncbi:hypothetical protein DFJ58DRAFT_883197 [Suillus subalutaceus]|uniref:uncharacterized protein n=1 Tax=Suillus subalutaceus TaxID=48586 RepID=UPI001B86829B|nr:uncharacterized protein DFJ58DRAFT_883197 [Suillus subalutaceus]KAG1853915.1 hypothetical protein DFJ58DRAFT_883197 [Suillus subalutaceus]
MPPMKRKLFGLSGLELQFAYEGLLKLQKSLVYDYDEEEEEEGRAPEKFGEQLKNMVSLLGSKLEGSRSYTFSGVTTDDSTTFNITYTGMLDLKPDFVQNVEKTKTLNFGLLRICIVNCIFWKVTFLGARVWIDAFLFRATAMLPSNKRMVLSTDHVVPFTNISSTSLRKLYGIIDYIATVPIFDLMANISFHDMKVNKPSSFFVIEAKLSDPSNHIAQAVSEIYACGKFLQQKVLRGALTNGHDWIFLLMKLNDDYNGASYARSPQISLGIQPTWAELVIPNRTPDLIAGILSHWINHSFSDLGSDDWFTV